MIRRLRKRHLRMVILLAVIVPLILGLALAARQPMPRQEIPAPLLGP